MKFCLLYISTFLFFSDVFSQGIIDGFYKNKNTGSIALGFGYEAPTNYFAGNERTDISRDLYYASIYANYGITDNINIQASLPYLSSNQESNFQDVSLFLKYRIYKTEVKNNQLEVSLGAGFSTPVTDYQLGGLNDIGQQATIFESRAMVHYKMQSGWFGTLQSGFSYKLEETPNSLPVALKIGKAQTNWYYDIFYQYQYSFGGIDYLGTPKPQNFKEFGVDFHKVGGTLYKPFSESFGAYVSLSYLISGRNSFQGPAFGGGVVYNFGK